MENNDNFLKKILTDSDGNRSSKRTIAFISFALMALGYSADVIWHVEVSEFMYDSLMWIVVAGIFGTALEKLNGSKK